MEITSPQLLKTSEEQKRLGFSAGRGLRWPRIFGTKHPYEEIAWEKRTAKITKGDGTMFFLLKIIKPAFRTSAIWRVGW